MADRILTRQVLELEQTQLALFYPILQKGVAVLVDVGCPLKSLLCDQFAIPETYVTDRITTVFLDNQPVDDLDHAIICNGSRIALSAAMPGLVGATMRRGGFYAALRHGISQLAQDSPMTHGKGTVTLKLFNLLLAEVGPLVLARGILLERSVLDKLLQNLPVVPDSMPDCGDRVLLSVTLTN